MKDSAKLAYAAALIDGEGCINISLHNQGFVVQIKVAMKDPGAITFMNENFGGNVTKYMQKNWGEMFQWSTSGKKCKELLLGIAPFLQVKKQQAEVALCFIETMGPPGAKLTDRTQMKRTMLKSMMNTLNAKRTPPKEVEDAVN